MRGDEHGLQGMNDTIFGNTVLHGDAGEPVDLDLNQAVPARNVDAKALVIEQCGEVNVEVALVVIVSAVGRGECELFLILSVTVVSVRVQGLVDDDVVLEQRLEVLESLLRVEEESVRSWAETAEGGVGRGEDGQATCAVVLGVLIILLAAKAGLLGSEEQG